MLSPDSKRRRRCGVDATTWVTTNAGKLSFKAAFPAGGCRKRHRSLPLTPSPQPHSRRGRGFSRSHALRGNAEAPRRGEHQAGVTIRIHGGNQTCRLSGVIQCGPEDVCSDRCRQLVMGSVSRLEDGGPSRPGTADKMSAPRIADILSAPGTTDLYAELPVQMVISQVGRVKRTFQGCRVPVFLSGYGAFRCTISFQCYEYAPNPTYRAAREPDTGSGAFATPSAGEGLGRRLTLWHWVRPKRGRVSVAAGVGSALHAITPGRTLP